MEQRVIKFRAWDSRNNKWFQDGSGFAIDWDASAITDDNDEPHDTARCGIILSQFTGLTDNNGKEIYEGDIVRAVDFSIDENFIPTTDVSHELTAAVKWDAGMGAWAVEVNSLEYGFCPLARFDQLEVTGNIYEHPALLNA